MHSLTNAREDWFCPFPVMEYCGCWDDDKVEGKSLVLARLDVRAVGTPPCIIRENLKSASLLGQGPMGERVTGITTEEVDVDIINLVEEWISRAP